MTKINIQFYFKNSDSNHAICFPIDVEDISALTQSLKTAMDTEDILEINVKNTSHLINTKDLVRLEITLINE